MSNSDVSLARALLTGYLSIDDKGRPHSRYLDAGSESEGRRALAKLLCSDKPMDRDLRYALAALFAPDGLSNEQEKPWLNSERKLIFKFRSRQRRTDSIRNTAVVQRVHEIIKSKSHSAEQAIATAAEEFRLSEDSVKRLWQGYSWARTANLISDPK